MGKIVSIKSNDQLEIEISYLLEQNRKGMVADFAMIYRTPTKENDQGESEKLISHYWFGSSVAVSGLVQRLARAVMDYFLGFSDG